MAFCRVFDRGGWEFVNLERIGDRCEAIPLDVWKIQDSFMCIYVYNMYVYIYIYLKNLQWHTY